MTHSRSTRLLFVACVFVNTASAQRTAPAAPPANGGQRGVELTSLQHVQLAGRSLGEYPFFEHVRAFSQGSTVEIAIDPFLLPQLAGMSVDVYVTATRTGAQWGSDPVLIDVAGGPQTVFIAASSIQDNRFSVDAGTLGADAGIGLGVGYDVVVDRDQNGRLDPDDWIDGGSPEAGFYVVHDTTLPGPLAVVEVLYSGGSFLGQDTYYPANIAAMGALPLVVVSHGNGHNYQWYDHIGEHLASYGYVVMSHQNDTVPGIESASTTTLTNTDYFLSNLDLIAGGVLDGHIDSSRMTWIGHSRGGEGVVRAYQRLLDGNFVPNTYTAADIRLLSSIAPTNFLLGGLVDPHDVNYHLWVGEADNDVSGCASSTTGQSFTLHDRAAQSRQSISLQGVGHGDFHDGGGSSVASGPCLVGRNNTHAIMRGYLLPLLHHYIQGNIPAEDFLWRQWESFRPIGAPASACVVVDLMYRPGTAQGTFVLDDFQTNPSTALSSAGGAVTFDAVGLSEGRLDDSTNSFQNSAADSMNGMTVAATGDNSRGIVFEVDGVDRFLAFEVPSGARDFTRHEYLSFRACQTTRHPRTTAELGDALFSVRLRDALGVTSDISIGAYGGGIEEPYQRTSCGTGTGWNNEWETIRIRLGDFQNSTPAGPPGGFGLELRDVVAVELLFGPSFGSASARLGFDELQLE